MRLFLLTYWLGLSAAAFSAPEATKLHQSAPVVDGHNDLPWAIRQHEKDLADFDFTQQQADFHTDLKRLKAGGVGLQLWSAYVPASTTEKGTALKTTLEQIDLIHRMIETYPQHLALTGSVQAARDAIQDGLIASMIGVEGGYSIEGSLANLRTFYRLGVRYMTLTHSQTIFWADSATDVAKHQGLTDFGQKVVAEMNRLGMLVDISHVSVQTMKDALAASQAPVIASHSSAFAKTNHVRNIPDDVLRLIAKNDGVVMVNFYSGYINHHAAKQMKQFESMRYKLRLKHPNDNDYRQAMKAYRKDNPMTRGTIKDVADHIDHIVKVAGIDHVGLGSDFDGVGTLPEGLDDASKYPNLTQELIQRGYTSQQLEKILGGNFYRALATAEKVATRLQKTMSH